MSDQDVVTVCITPFDKGKIENSRGMSRKVECLGAWDVGPHEPTSDEDEDGVARPKRGAGRVGRDSPMLATHDGAQRPSTDVCGLWPPCRWPPSRRHVDTLAVKMRTGLQNILEDVSGDLTQVAYAMACHKFMTSPFPGDLLRAGRQILKAVVGHADSDWTDAPSEGSPSFSIF